jgi:Arc/MetJ-type ribon-helix-helix transcriptional regulator
MATVNLSLTNDQLKWIDKSAAELGFANRSEFVRSILRFISQRADLLADTRSYPFVSPSTTQKSEIVSAFKKTGKYSSDFLSDLESGLSRSDYFK